MACRCVGCCRAAESRQPLRLEQSDSTAWHSPLSGHPRPHLTTTAFRAVQPQYSLYPSISQETAAPLNRT